MTDYPRVNEEKFYKILNEDADTLHSKVRDIQTVLNHIDNIAYPTSLNTLAGSKQYSTNETLVEKFDLLSKTVGTISKRLSQKSEELSNRIQAGKHGKRDVEEVQYLYEVRSSECNKSFKKSRSLTKTHSVDDCIENVDQLDNLKQSKTTERAPVVNSFICRLCHAVFLNYKELYSHQTNHKLAFYHCFVCLKVFRSFIEFENHSATRHPGHTLW